MNNLQLKLDVFWNKKKSSNNCVTHPTENEIHMLPSSSFPSLKTVEAQTRTCENEFIFSNEVTVGEEAEVENGLVVRNDAENEDEIKIINEPSCNESLSSKNDQNKNSSVGVKECSNKKIKPVRSNHRTKYKPSWELLTDAQYKTYIFDHCGVNLLPAEVSGVTYRNDTAALCFLQHIAAVLHQDLIEKIKNSTSLRWMLDESTSRTTEKSCIIDVHYVENYEAKTAYYGVINLDGDGSAGNIIKALTSMWEKDGLHPTDSCWLATDNAATFTDIHEGVIAKLKRHLSAEWLESTPCVAHSFALVGGEASYLQKSIHTQKPIRAESVVKLETTLTDIYNYFGRNSNRQFRLKSWQAFMEMPEIKMKKIFDIRWSSISGCIKPIVDNVYPGSQALLTCLQQIMLDTNASNTERENAKSLLNSILEDEFLFLLHMHHDLHEIVLSSITKIMQHDNLSYFYLMETIAEKRKMLSCWASESSSIMGPALCDYIESTESGSFDGFKIKLGDRKKFRKDCREHVERLIQQLDKRFKPSIVQESLSILFDPQHCWIPLIMVDLN
ncbi:unnamed protein product [Rotaria sordida]|uniref:DUF4371 domain-containing protein n=1 Tax=Rotaria sordida TaxID=392033 RepID=A0A813V606_9BILA|nr:unnamed protein product [Rotaria sordida]CAF0832867.1 unnamed protein product [Rotaria sordida]CAF0834712.1 unnamed protein product [Rotaria sordida]CAF0973757.1 unnamed protein product [Rotaria sordida]CAF1038196.1 unnamed protein product [Rotaria sordida]